MTAYLILRDHPMKPGKKGPEIPVDAAGGEALRDGQGRPTSRSSRSPRARRSREYEALQAVMLPSANNVARLLARWDTKSDSEDAFVAKMNKTAKELGMKNTHYTDPSGLDKTTVSTAEDQVKLGRAAMEDPVFSEISRPAQLQGPQRATSSSNFFGLVPTIAIGIKTGHHHRGGRQHALRRGEGDRRQDPARSSARRSVSTGTTARRTSTRSPGSPRGSSRPAQGALDSPRRREEGRCRRLRRRRPGRHDPGRRHQGRRGRRLVRADREAEARATRTARRSRTRRRPAPWSVC